MTMTEQVLARHAARKTVAPGDNIWVDVDILMTHDVCGPGTIGIFRKQFGPNAKVWDPEKVVIIPDHYIFTNDQHAHRNIDVLRAFVKEQGLPYYYDVGTDKYKGVCHIALPEEGHTRPGEVLFGTDSHTCTAGAFGEFATGIGNTDAALIMGIGKLWVKVPETMRFEFEGPLPPYLMAKDLILHIIGDIGVDGATYRAMEFAGDGVMSLSIEERMTLCNMVIEAGGKNGVIPVDAVTEKFVKTKTAKPYEPVKDNPGARFHSVRRYKSAAIEPTVAKPHSPDNRATARECHGIKLDRAYIGSCTGGKLNDFVAAAQILKGRQVKADTYIVPATTEVARGLATTKLNGETLLEIFQKSGAKIAQGASCAACLGGPSDTFGRLNKSEVCISTTNRNFPGRMGHRDSQVYLANPAVVTASAITGYVCHPE
ncbi:MAG TPA: aconitase/3-isopropylmalate dehydratase large subunit family protein, partial [Nitrospirales bacterium]|nr:aconitase/3-isopropylmalate dehydratase large subunit family protein [Nitrospirales bacterium]